MQTLHKKGPRLPHMVVESKNVSFNCTQDGEIQGIKKNHSLYKAILESSLMGMTFEPLDITAKYSHKSSEAFGKIVHSLQLNYAEQTYIKSVQNATEPKPQDGLAPCPK